MEDNSVEKHLGRIRTKIADTQIDELIKEHMNWNPEDLRMLSVQYFAESGVVNGNLHLAILDIAKQFVEFAIEQPLINKYKNEVLLNKQQKDKRSVASKVDSSNTADKQNPSQVSDEEDLEPSKEQDSEPVASHSSGVGNSIEQVFSGSEIKIVQEYLEFHGIGFLHKSVLSKLEDFALWVVCNHIDLPKINPIELVNRVEVIDDKGRSYVNWKDALKVHLDYQDAGRTLKVFIRQMPNIDPNDERIATQQTMPEEPKAGIQNYPN